MNRRLIGSPVTRPLYIALWVPNGLVVGCESLFVPYGNAASGGHGSLAGCLFAAAASTAVTLLLVPGLRRSGPAPLTAAG